jgi:SAM-dependent methyltransferase
MSSPKASQSKLNEIDYIDNISKIKGVSRTEVENYHLGKPFLDNRRGWYLMDLGQILKLLPGPPARLLDLGVGSGWTSKYLALSGYQVVGLDIADSMIRLAKSNCADVKNVDFFVCDYEAEIDQGLFDCALIYDALHHATDEVSLLRNVYSSLKPGGSLVTAEPGRGHSQSDNTKQAVKDFGVTEKDMDFSLQKKLLQGVGFSQVRQFYRLSELSLEDISSEAGRNRQVDHFANLHALTLEAGLTSIVVAVK